MKFYFVGSHTIVHHLDAQGHVSGALVTLDRFGMQCEGTEAEASEWMRGGCALLTEAEFKGIGFTDAELKTFDTPGKQLAAPNTFKAKQQKAWAIYGEKWQALHGMKPAEAVKPVESPKPPDAKAPEAPKA